MQTWMDAVWTIQPCSICTAVFDQFMDGHPEMVIPEVERSDVAVEFGLFDLRAAPYMAEGCLELSIYMADRMSSERSRWHYRPERGLTRNIRAVPEKLLAPDLADTWPADGVSMFDICSASTRTRLYTCFHDHAMCTTVLDRSPFLPSRLLEVSHDGGGTPLVRLITPGEKGMACRYLTLSYTWGRNVALQLTSATLATLTQGIMLTALPQTFQDALVLTLRLEQRYLWIDALCIVQDDADDWQRESALMADIYGNLHLKIAATSSENSQDGIFKEQHELNRPPEQIESSWENASNGNYYLLDTPFWHCDWTDIPLNTRGWVVQESILAPRIIHLHTKQLLWQCKSLTATHIFPNGLPPKSIFSKQMIRPSVTMIPYSMRLWKDMVELYSQRDLTFETDKLIAIAGVTKRISTVSQDEYCAGLWRKDLLAQLLWNTSYGLKASGDEAVRVKRGNLPTWSWASVDGKISYFFSPIGDCEYVVSVIDCTIGLVAQNSFGQICSAILRLRGHLYPFPAKIPNTDRVEYAFGSHRLLVRSNPLRVAGNVYRRRVIYDLRDKIKHDDESEKLRSLKYLPIAIVPQHDTSDEDSPPAFIGLALEHTAKRGHYKRYGLFVAQPEALRSYFANPKNRCKARKLYCNKKATIIALV